MFLMPGARARPRVRTLIPHRTLLTSNLTLYVSTTGNDNNSGLLASQPWKTITHAVNAVMSQYDLGGSRSVTIQLADGTYTENVVLGQYVGYGSLGQSTLTIQGNSSDHNAVVLSPSSGNTIQGVGVATPWTIKNLKVTSAGQGVLSDAGSFIQLDGVNFGACNIGVQVLYGSIIEFTASNYTISGNMAVGEYAQNHGRIIHAAGATVTISGAPNFSSFFAFASDLGLIFATSTTYSGAATGTRWSSISNAVIETGSGASATYFPGNVNGSTGSGGQYL